jgi:hypothetical protein
MERPTVIHIRDKGLEPYVYIGRPSKWGNPFYLSAPETRDSVCEKYRAWIVTQPKLMALLPTLAGKRLACFCAPKRCHGDVLADLVEALPVVPKVGT